jgi:hypothetical protein
LTVGRLFLLSRRCSNLNTTAMSHSISISQQ